MCSTEQKDGTPKMTCHKAQNLNGAAASQIAQFPAQPSQWRREGDQLFQGWREALQPETQTTCSSSAVKVSKTSPRAAPSILLLLGRRWAAACSPGTSSMASTEGPEATTC